MSMSHKGTSMSMLRGNDAEVKSIIETTLLKSAGLLSDFTENTISHTSTYFSNMLSPAPERFGFTLNPSPIIQQRIRARNVKKSNANHNLLNGLGVGGRRKPDVSKLPSSIVDILREDSNSSIPSMQKSKKYSYHSRKMALKQRTDSSKDKVFTPLTKSSEIIAPRIVLISTPLTLQQDSFSIHAARTQEQPNINNSFVPTSMVFPDTYLDPSMESTDSKKSTLLNMVPRPRTTAIKSEKKPTINASSIVRKPDKLTIGVDNGVAFILGSKTKAPYLNTFGSKELDHQGNLNELSSRKWVVNVGNFLDNEISLTLMGNYLTITGFRQPSLAYPEGQTVSESIPLPPEIDVHNLRIYRANDAKAFLVIQEKQ